MGQTLAYFAYEEKKGFITLAPVKLKGECLEER